MPTYRLVFLPAGDEPARSMSFVGSNPAAALSLAQGHPGRTELWLEHEHICTIEPSDDRSMWTISPGRGKRGLTLAVSKPEDFSGD